MRVNLHREPFLGPLALGEVVLRSGANEVSDEAWSKVEGQDLVKWFLEQRIITIKSRGGAEVARLAHTQEVAGSSPVPASKPTQPVEQAAPSGDEGQHHPLNGDPAVESQEKSGAAATPPPTPSKPKPRRSRRKRGGR